MQSYLPWYIISFFGLTFLNIFFSSTLVLTSSIDVVFILFYKVTLEYIDASTWLYICISELAEMVVNKNRIKIHVFHKNAKISHDHYDQHLCAMLHLALWVLNVKSNATVEIEVKSGVSLLSLHACVWCKLCRCELLIYDIFSDFTVLKWQAYYYIWKNIYQG